MAALDVLAGLTTVGTGLATGLVKRKQMREQLVAQGAQQQFVNQLAMINALSNAVKEGADPQQANALLASVFPQLQRQKIIATEAPKRFAPAPVSEADVAAGRGEIVPLPDISIQQKAAPFDLFARKPEKQEPAFKSGLDAIRGASQLLESGADPEEVSKFLAQTAGVNISPEGLKGLQTVKSDVEKSKVSLSRQKELTERSRQRLMAAQAAYQKLKTDTAPEEKVIKLKELGGMYQNQMRLAQTQLETIDKTKRSIEKQLPLLDEAAKVKAQNDLLQLENDRNTAQQEIDGLKTNLTDINAVGKGALEQIRRKAGIPEDKTARAKAFLESQGYEADDAAIRMFLSKNPKF